ncbi:carbohydrate ABC transporter permease [Streptomyces smyrnaeus]|uniref:Sugar ABC transporter permease n=1 Tax=Streptomyces smyrnaeus TaxID=1387713 RepID=A0ABS3XY41_9ACTN|nr:MULTISPECIES: sugar ABC transporter permease [Streptomyces]MBO8200330.1 sugar ABC transporter permease [Streptomyces smyrnaeus]MBQ0865990.1 sugar ABC transporter permease [Streptomyces sp. RK75]MBQ1122927.1 sugar ABC transporter permease [Streptomyces sp. B15]MBQ1162768.1 sugar ABC transporter permease [Streptomyces sp. A73]
MALSLSPGGAGGVDPRLRRKKARDRLRTVGFLSPWLVGFSVFFGYPLIATGYFSFMHYNQIKQPEFVGWRNWSYVFTQMPLFGPALWNTLWLVVVMVALRVVFGIGVGLLVTKLKSGIGFFRTAFYVPYLAPPVAATVAFVFLLNPATGPVNELLSKVGVHAPNWFNDPAWSKPSLVMLSLWGIGDLMVIFMAALLDVPKEQYEAAELDGAGPWARFRYVTWPNITPIVMFAVVTGVVQTMQYYTQALVAGKLASGVTIGPGTVIQPGYPDHSTITVPQLVYQLGFQNFNTGAACVLSLVLFAIAMAVTILLMRRSSGLLSAED